MEMLGQGVLDTHAETGLLRTAPQPLKFLPEVKHHDPHVEFFSSNSEVWKKRYPYSHGQFGTQVPNNYFNYCKVILQL